MSKVVTWDKIRGRQTAPCQLGIILYLCVTGEGMVFNMQCVWRGYQSYVVGLGVPLFPLDKDQLGDNQSDNQNQHHLCMHGLMPLVFGMHPGMLHPMDTNMRWSARLGERLHYATRL